MSFTPPGLPRGYRYPQEHAWTSFAGGLNLRDRGTPSEMGPTDVTDSWNVSYDERGGAVSRLGYAKFNNVAYGTDVTQNIYWSSLLGAMVTNAGTKLYLGTANTAVHTFTTTERVTFTQIGTFLIASHPTDGLFRTTDGTTWTACGTLGVVTVTVATPAVFSFAAHGLVAGDQVKFTTTGALPTGLTAGTVYFVIAAGLTANAFEVSTTSGGSAVNTTGSQSGVHTLFRSGVPTGTCIATWQTKVWVGKPNGQVQWSAIGDPDHWVPTDFNDIWEKDAQPIIALHIGSGQDIQGRPGLYVFKNESTYRINDSATGAYETVDSTIGAASNISLVGLGGKVYVLGRYGIFMCQDGQVGLVNMSDKLKPLWNPAQVNLGELALWSAGRRDNRAVFSLTRAASTANDLKLELHVDQGWIAPGSDAMAAYTTKTTTDDALYGASPTVVGQTYVLESGGTDDGAPISGWIQTNWGDLLGGFSASLIHVRIRGRGTANVEFRRDYHESGDMVASVQMSDPTSVTYDSGLMYDSGTDYYVPADEPTVTLYPPTSGCRQLSVRLSFTTSTTVPASQLLGAGSAPQVGPFGLFLVETMFMRTGIS